MQGSKIQNSYLRRAAQTLLKKNDNDKEFEAELSRYESLFVNDEGEVPSEIDLLNPELSLKTLLRLSIQKSEDNEFTDALLNLKENDRTVRDVSF